MSGYTKIFASMLQSSVWLEKHHVRIVWITMLMLANREGIVEASVPGLANSARVSLEECEEALERLSAPDPYSRTKAHDGRRITETDGGWELLTYAQYRAMSGRVSAAERAQRYRDRHAKRDGVTPKRDDRHEKRDGEDVRASDRDRHEKRDDRHEKRDGVTHQCDDRHKSVTIVTSVGSGVGSKSDLLDLPTQSWEELDPNLTGSARVDGRADRPASPTLADRAAARLRDPGAEATDPSAEWPEVQQALRVCAELGPPWAQHAHPRGGLRDPRLRLLLERYAQGYTPEQCAQAVRGLAKSDLVAESPAQASPVVAWRDGERVDRWGAAATTTATSGRRRRRNLKVED